MQILSAMLGQGNGSAQAGPSVAPMGHPQTPQGNPLSVALNAALAQGQGLPSMIMRAAGMGQAQPGPAVPPLPPANLPPLPPIKSINFATPPAAAATGPVSGTSPQGPSPTQRASARPSPAAVAESMAQASGQSPQLKQWLESLLRSKAVR